MSLISSSSSGDRKLLEDNSGLSGQFVPNLKVTSSFIATLRDIRFDSFSKIGVLFLRSKKDEVLSF